MTAPDPAVLTVLRRHAVLLAALVTAAAVVLPLLAPGFVLNYDLSFVPRPRISGELLGITSEPPRRVLLGLVVASTSRLLPGELVEKLLLASVFVIGFCGAARLLRGAHPVAMAAAGLLYVWNPYVYERMALGQVAFLLSYAVLPWIVAAALEVRRGSRSAVPALVLWLFAAAVTGPYGGAFGLLLAMGVLLVPPGRGQPVAPRALALIGGVAVNLTWLVPSLLSRAAEPSSRLAVDAFAARSDSPLGLVGSLLSLGGLWRTDLAPPARNTLVWVVPFLVIAAVAVWGWPSLRERLPPGSGPALLGLAVLGFVAAGGPSFPVTGAAYRWAAESLPGGGFLRDSQKFLAPLAILLAAAFGAGLGRLVGAVPVTDAGWRRAVAGFALLPVVVVPALAWGLSGWLFTTPYPPSWDQARRVMAADAEPGAILVLPWHLHMPFTWNRGRAVIDPALSYFTRRAVTSDALEVGLARIPPEDPWAALAEPTVLSGEPDLLSEAGRLGFRYVLLHKDADWTTFVDRLDPEATVLDTRELTLYRVEGEVRPPGLPEPPAAPIVAGHIVAALVAAGAAAAWTVRRGILPRRPVG